MFHYDFTELFSPKKEISSLLFNVTIHAKFICYVIKDVV